MRRRCISIRRRSAIVIALAAVGALAVTGIALGAGSSSATYFSFSPSNPHGVVTSGRLIFGTNTIYSGRHLDDPDTAPLRRRLLFQPGLLPEVRPGRSSRAQPDHAAGDCRRAGPPPGPPTTPGCSRRPRPSATGRRCSTSAPKARPPACWCSTARVPRPRSCCSSGSTADQLAGPIDCAIPTTNTDGDNSFLVRGDLKANPGARRRLHGSR